MLNSMCPLRTTPTALRGLAIPTAKHRVAATATIIAAAEPVTFAKRWSLHKVWDFALALEILVWALFASAVIVLLVAVYP